MPLVKGSLVQGELAPDPGKDPEVAQLGNVVTCRLGSMC